MSRKPRKPKPADAKIADNRDLQSRAASYREGVLLPATLSAIALWAAFAPVNLSLLAWLAPAGWVLIVAREKPVGRAGYFSLWLSGCVFWLLILHGIRLAFWPLYFGWLALSLYLAVYTPLFVGTARILVWRLRMPLAIAAPVAWVGMELIRSYVLTGFAGNTLAHSQAHSPIVIQLADQLGTGGISFVMMVVCTATLQLVLAIRMKRASSAIAPVALACLLFVGLMAYGWWKLAEADALAAKRQPMLRVLLVQENTPTVFEYNREKNQRAWTRYLNATREGARTLGIPDMVAWPESTFTANEPLLESDLKGELPQELLDAGYDERYLADLIQLMQGEFEFKVANVLAAAVGKDPGILLNQATAEDDTTEAPETSENPPYLLVGHDAWLYTSQSTERFNSAFLIAPSGELIDRYSKMHLVMIGEYMPWGLQWLGNIFGFAGAQAGRTPKSFPIENELGETVRVSPSICFESMVPHLISGQVRELARAGESPDVLINLSNDSWFRGSSALDHHLASSILAAVENRRPMLVAANTGISAEISGSGRVKQASERLVKSVIMAEPKPDNRGGLVQWLGYPLSWICGLVSCCSWFYAFFVPKRADTGLIS